MKVVTELMAGLCNDVMTHKPIAFQSCKYIEKWLGVILQQLYHHVLINRHLTLQRGGF
jgi:hypothetical protein